MNYPSISEYAQALRAPEDHFGEQLKHLRLVLDGTNQPVMSSGSFAVVFKMTDGERFYALKCFTKEQAGRDEAYRQIAEELSSVQYPFLVHFDYYEAALSVATGQTDETKFPVLLMDWVDGVPLDKYIATIAHDDREARERLLHELLALMTFLLPQCFAHGDLEPDNILVQKDGRVKLLDYDGMYVPAMDGQAAREAGNPLYRPRLLQKLPFDRNIDDYAAVLILLLAAYNVHTPCNFNDLIKDDPTEFVSQFQDFMDDPFICSLLAAYRLAATQGKLKILAISVLALYNTRRRKGSQGILMDGEMMSALMKSLTGSTINGHDCVDLGLSVKWATCNVGASSPGDCGDYFAWGETSIKATYDRENSKTFERGYYDIGGNDSLDAARANWGGTWRLPTKAEMEEIVDKCTWTWTTLGGKEGYKVTGPSGRSIFLPAAGGRYGAFPYNDAYGSYWTSAPDESYNGEAYALYFNASYHYVDWRRRGSGRSVRPVSE